MARSRVCYLLCASLVAIESSAADGPPPDVKPGAFSRSYLNPWELQFGCVGTHDDEEERYAKQLAAAEADPSDQLKAAKTLWRGRSRRYAVDVLKFLAGPPPGGESFRAFQREVDASVRPEAILRELGEGDYLWGTWLAFIHPHKDFVPALLAGLKDRPDMLPETMLALGNSGDRRAINPLIDLLGSNDRQAAGYAAKALGYLGDPEAEPRLIEALAKDNLWRQVNVCWALAKMGTCRALPALETLAKDNRPTGTLNVRRWAEYAVKKIKGRENR